MVRRDKTLLRGYRAYRGIFLLALGACLIFRATAAAQWEDSRNKFLRTNPQFLDAFRKVVATPSQSTVRVRCDGEDVALGTIVGADGWVLTKASDLKGKTVCRLRDGRDLDARLVGIHEGHDLALLRIDAKGLPPVQWRASKEDSVGDWVASAGTGDQPVSVGVISVAARKLPPVRNPAVRDLVGTGYLGIDMDESVKEGVKVKEVVKGSAAAKAGLKVDDLLLAVAGKAVRTSEAVKKKLGEYKPGDVVTLRIKREGEEVEVEAQLGKRPTPRVDQQNTMGSELSQRRVGFPDILQHDSVVKPRDCGGPLVDLDGKVIGVNICRAGRTESYAVPAEVIRPLLPELMSGRLAPRVAAAPDSKTK